MHQDDSIAPADRADMDSTPAQDALTGGPVPHRIGRAKIAALPHLKRNLARQFLLLGALVAGAVLLKDRIAALDLPAIADAFHALTPAQWLGAMVATAISFAALAQYDVVLHRLLQTRAAPAPARRAGWVAIALSQTLGFGLISGALLRWRMLPQITLFDASRLTAAVAASFLAAWAILTAITLLILPVPLAGTSPLTLRALAGLALFAGLALAATSLLRPDLRIGRLRLAMPPLPAMGQILALALIDTLAACAALYVLLPPEVALPFSLLFPAFLIALGAGLISGSPAGIGPFELTLIAALPMAPEAPLIAAILAWRVSYYALPALAAMGFALWPQRARSIACAPQITRPDRATIALMMQQARQAELGLLRQGEHALLSTRNGHWMVGRGSQTLAALLDPSHPSPDWLADLRRIARSENRVACAYKITPRMAATARRAGWATTLVAFECVLDPMTFSLDTPARAGLRRKLRKAEKAGVTAARPRRPLPLSPLAILNARWARARGGERGFSMGRFAPDYVADQEVIVAKKGNDIIGFASFHATRTEWVLDLVRPAPNAPDGTMHALILAAIEAARADNIPRLSLAALPPEAADTSGIAARIWARADNGAAKGLRQFKSGFDPRLEPRYIAAPNRAALTLAAADIATAIRAPAQKSVRAAKREIARAARAGKRAAKHAAKHAS